jgi:hypothetical protein
VTRASLHAPLREVTRGPLPEWDPGCPGLPALSGPLLPSPRLRPARIEAPPDRGRDGPYGNQVDQVPWLTEVDARRSSSSSCEPQGGCGLIDLGLDGPGENGALVAPGGYTIRIVVTDSHGQTATGEALISLDY